MATVVEARKILLADASPTVRALARLSLAGERLTVLAAAGGEEALDLARLERPDVIIADAMLSDIDGYQLCRLAREALPSVHFVLMTADYLPLDEALAAEVGVSYTLRKPFDRRTLLQAVLPQTGTDAPSVAPTSTSAPASAPNREESARPEPLPASPTDLHASPSAEDIATAVALALPEILERLLPPLVDAALARIVADRLPDALSELRELVEPVVWKSVPALAEQLIKEEITRLTAEVED